ncbi:MAG: hypothetical protein H6825_01535 [Planctomycetes bacterium]|nr:hypothetical protein [Planctomycetota bacterium]
MGELGPGCEWVHVPLVTSEQVGVTATLLALALAFVFVRSQRGRGKRFGLACIACVLWSLGIVAGHAGDDAGPTVLVVFVAANLLAAATLLPLPKGKDAATFDLLLVGFIDMTFLSIIQAVLLVVATHALSPWAHTSSVGRVVVSLENERDGGVSVTWLGAPDDPWCSEPLAFDVPPDESRRAFVSVGNDSSGPATVGTLTLRADDGEPLIVAVDAPERAHLALRLAEDGSVWLRIGRDGCFGAPSFGDERRVGDVVR